MAMTADAMRGLVLVTAVIGATAACGKYSNVQCEQDSNCDLSSGGVCTANETGNRWCAYPDTNCPNGYRYSNQAIGDGVSSQCVIEPDANLDSIPDWISRRGGPGDDYGNGIAAAPNGDLIMVGDFTGTISLGGSALASGPAWVARYRPDGAHLWSKAVGDGASAERVAVDSHGDVYVEGRMSGTVDLGGGERSAARGWFLVKLSGSTGDYIWDRVVPTDANAYLAIGGLAMVDDNVAVCGIFSDIDLGAGTLHAANGDRDNFVVVYTGASGSYLWAHPFTSTGEEDGECAVVAVSDDLVVAADFAETVMTGGPPLTAIGNADVLLARYRGTDGTHMWSVGHGGPMATMDPLHLASDGTRIFLGGHYNGHSVNLGGADLQLTTSGDGQGFVAAFDPSNGSHLWSEPFAQRVTALAAGSTKLTAGSEFQGTIMLGSVSLTAVGSNTDVAMARFDPATGALGSAITKFGGAGADSPAELSQILYTSDRLAGIGTFTSSAKLESTTLSSSGGKDIAAFRVDF